MSQSLELTIPLSKPWPSQNELGRMVGARERWKHRQLMQGLAGEISRHIDAVGFRSMFMQCQIFATRYSTSTLDIQNAQGGLKPVIDVLVLQSHANPYGLGIIRGDDIGTLTEVTVDQAKLTRADKGESRSEITIIGTALTRSEVSAPKG